MKLVRLTPSLPEPGQATTPGHAPASSLLAEALREEAQAAQLVTRTSLLARVHRRLSLGETDRELLAELLDQLVKLGDLIAGPHGQIAPAPVRVVELSDGALVLLGAVSTAVAQEQLGLPSLGLGLPRHLTAGPDPTGSERARVRSWVDAQAGLWLNVARWSGLARMPSWQGWLDELRARRILSDDPVSGPATWPEREFFVADPRRPIRPRRWRAAPLTDDATLVRTRREHGWSYGLAWRDEGGMRGFRLSADEARRTYCALAAAVGCPLTFRQRAEEGVVTVTIEPWLPRAEHRALQLSSTRSGAAGEYQIPLNRWQALLPLIEERTGMTKGPIEP